MREFNYNNQKYFFINYNILIIYKYTYNYNINNIKEK